MRMKKFEYFLNAVHYGLWRGHKSIKMLKGCEIWVYLANFVTITFL